MLEMPRNILIVMAAVAAALIAIPAEPGWAQALSFSPVLLPVEVQTSPNVELAAMHGRRFFYSSRGGYRGGVGYGARYGFHGGGYAHRWWGGRSYARNSYSRYRYRHHHG